LTEAKYISRITNQPSRCGAASKSSGPSHGTDVHKADCGLGFVDEADESSVSSLGHQQRSAVSIKVSGATGGSAIDIARDFVTKLQVRMDIALQDDDYDRVAQIQPRLEHAIRTLHALESHGPQVASLQEKPAADDLLTVEELSTELLGMGFEEDEIAKAMPVCLAAAETAGGLLCMEDIVSMLLDTE